MSIDSTSISLMYIKLFDVYKVIYNVNVYKVIYNVNVYKVI